MSQLDHDEPTTGIDPLQELGKQLPWDRPDASRREAVRSSLLVAASDAPPRRASRALFVGAGFLAGALAAAAVALLLVRSPSSPPRENYAQIESSSVAELEHTSTRTASGADEVVRVRAGKVRLAVPAVRAGDRVRTKTGNAEVEGTGAYEVIVANDKLTSVRVSSGTAKVIVDGQTVVLASGETWTAPILTADLSITPPPAAPAPVIADPAHVIPPGASKAPEEASRDNIGEIKTRAESTSILDKPRPSPATASRSATPSSATPSAAPSISPTPSTAPRSTAPSTASSSTPSSSPSASTSSITTTAPPTPAPATSPSEQHFHTGWALLRESKYSAAADELAIAAAGSGPLASDARYFQAVALTKAGRASEAEAALVVFLDGAATSTRRGRAAVMLGRLIAARGDARSARAWFTSALTDPDASVAGAARAELAKLSSR